MRISESQLRRVVKRLIREQAMDPMSGDSVAGSSDMSAPQEARGLRIPGRSLSYSESSMTPPWGNLDNKYEAYMEDIKWKGAPMSADELIRSWPDQSDISGMSPQERIQFLAPWGGWYVYNPGSGNVSQTPGVGESGRVNDPRFGKMLLLRHGGTLNKSGQVQPVGGVLVLDLN